MVIIRRTSTLEKASACCHGTSLSQTLVQGSAIQPLSSMRNQDILLENPSAPNCPLICSGHCAAPQ